MEQEQFSKFRHKAVHELMDLNELCEKEYGISSWPKWEYDLDRGTLAFIQDGVPRVLHRFRLWERLPFPAGRGFGDGRTKASPPK
jgi:hypothetical protein